MSAQEREEPACRLDELPADEMRLVTVRQRKIVLMRVDDDVYAFQNACPHKSGPLNEGTLHTGRSEIICPWHRFRFDLKSGASVTNPALVARTYPVSVRDGQIFVTV